MRDIAAKARVSCVRSAACPRPGAPHCRPALRPDSVRRGSVSGSGPIRVRHPLGVRGVGRLAFSRVRRRDHVRVVHRPHRVEVRVGAAGVLRQVQDVLRDELLGVLRAVHVRRRPSPDRRARTCPAACARTRSGCTRRCPDALRRARLVREDAEDALAVALVARCCSWRSRCPPSSVPSAFWIERALVTVLPAFQPQHELMSGAGARCLRRTSARSRPSSAGSSRSARPGSS